MTAKSQSALLEIARRGLHLLVPGLYRRISHYRNDGRHDRVAKKLVGRYGRAVLSGPFRGMRYTTASAGSVLNPKLIGCYEAELHAVIEGVLRQDYDTVVDIGCAEGYYAVGFLLKMKRARGIAFDLDPQARELCREMAVLNCVSQRLEIEGKCDVASLQRAIRGRTFVLCDCEGDEVQLLDPHSIPSLRHCDILVEIHDFLRPGTMQSLLPRFSQTHDLETIDQQDRDPRNYPELALLSKHNRWFAVQEFRPGRMQWITLSATARQ